MDDDRQLTPNFHISELMCRDGTPVPRELVDNARRICERAQLLRDVVGPLVVISGYRTMLWNHRVKGAKRSYHLTASALDLRSARRPARELLLTYLRLIKLGRVPDGGVGIYPTFLHIDLGTKRRWGQ